MVHETCYKVAISSSQDRDSTEVRGDERARQTPLALRSPRRDLRQQLR